MASRNFQEALNRLLRDEGGYTNHPDDPGGPTNWGITLADARLYWKSDADAPDVKAMPETVARKIYREHYWKVLRCDELSAGVDYTVFDYGVNSGVRRAGKVLRRILALPDQTSAVTDDVIAKATITDAEKLVAAICTERLAFLKNLKTFPTFGRGWTRRVLGVQAAAQAMMRSDGNATSKVTVTSSSQAPTNIPTTSSAKTIGSGIVVAGGAIASTAQNTTTAFLIFGIACMAAIALMLVWYWRDRIRQEITRVTQRRPSNGLE